MADNAPAFLNQFPAGPVPTPQGNPGHGFVRHGALDPGNAPGPVHPPEGLPGPIHMQSGWHIGPGVSVTQEGQSTYGQFSTDDLLDHSRRLRDAELEQELAATAEMAAQQASTITDKALTSAEYEAAAVGREATTLLPKLAGYAAITALGFAAGRKFAPMMPVARIRGSVPTAGALTGYGVASLVYKDTQNTIGRTMMMVAAAVVGAYAADIIYPSR